MYIRDELAEELRTVVLKVSPNISWSQSRNVGNVAQIGRYRSSAAQEEVRENKNAFLGEWNVIVMPTIQTSKEKYTVGT
jgi:hypothetical protein